MEKVLVTGSNGVLGSAFFTLSARYSDYLFQRWDKAFDLRRSDETTAWVKMVKPDVIIHTAVVSGGVGLSDRHPAVMLRDNVRIDLNILEAARSVGVGKVIMTLSSGMYPPLYDRSDFVGPLYECDIHQGYPHDSNYALAFAKRLIDPMIRAYREEYGMNVIGLVPNGIFGEHDYFGLEDSYMVAALIRKFYEAKQYPNNNYREFYIDVWGDGTPLREITYAQDLAGAYMWCLENYDDKQILNVGTTEENSVRDTAYMIADFMDVDTERIKFDTTKLGGPYRKGTDNSQFLALSNFEYTPFKEALEKTILWYTATMQTAPQTIRIGSKVRL